MREDWIENRKLESARESASFYTHKKWAESKQAWVKLIHQIVVRRRRKILYHVRLLIGIVPNIIDRKLMVDYEIFKMGSIFKDQIIS